MNLLWIDATNGAAGDMLLAALLDAGADEAHVRTGLAGIGGIGLGLTVTSTRRYGLHALRVTIQAPGRTKPRRLDDILALVAAANLAEPVRDFTCSVFRALARAEARVHGTRPAQVHFHEVGALDAIADITGCGLALESLGLLAPDVTAVVSPIALGAGVASTAHGRLPLPAPGTVRLLADAGAPVAAHPARFELCTPTGAALLTTLATGWGPVPAGVLRATGTGAGTADPASHPNVLRVLIGETTREQAQRAEELVVLDATIDDLDPRLWPDVLDELHRAGALDAWCAPVLMRKGRPGHVLTALAAPSTADAVATAVFRHTTTLGLRAHPVSRRALDRDKVAVTWPGQSSGGGHITIKRGLLAGEVVTVQPEYEDVREAAGADGLPVRIVLEGAKALADAFGERGQGQPAVDS